MPELPEVETVRRSLAPHVVGKTIATIEALHPKTIRNAKRLQAELPGQTIASIERIGKLLLFSLKKSPWTLTAHLKMTGQFIFVDAVATAGGGHTLSKTDLKLPHAHTRVAIHFADGSTLYFNDLRLFGYLDLVDPDERELIEESYGIEPLQPDFTPENFAQIFKGRKTNLKALLLNQQLIAGLGNIYVDEACHYAKVLPMRQVDSLTKKEIKELYDGCQHVIADAIKHGGTTFYSFLHTDGKKGSYLDQLQVFARQGKPCHRCGHIIVKIKHAGRGTHYCPHCQK